MPDYGDGAYQGICNGCHRVATLSVMGLVRPHRAPSPELVGFDGWCRGSLEAPLSVRPVDTIYLPGDSPRTEPPPR